jgi:diguanylate cyclase (GGDEF)-like protein
VLAPQRGSDREVPVASAVAFAVLICAGLPVAALAQLAAAAVEGVRRRPPLRTAVWDALASIGGLAAAAVVLGALTPVPRGGGVPFAPGDLPAMLLAAAVLLAVRAAARPGDASFFVVAAGGAIGLAPIAVLAGAFSPALLPLLVLPLAALHVSGRAAVRSQHLALHDVLTGLPNRALFQDRVDRALAAARRDATRPVVMLLDLNRFKEVNDRLGHHHGDDLLRQVGPRIASVLRTSDTVARLGGDEFAVLLPKAPDTAAGADVAEKIREALTQPFRVSGMELEVGASIGLACFPEHGEDVETLVRRADAAMYVAKQARSGPELYESGRDEQGADQVELVGELRRAMDEGELHLVFHPKVDLRTGECRGAEALVRWRHPERGVVLPASFVAHAELTGLMRPMTLHVLEVALAQVAEWHRAGLDLTVAVNLSVRSLLDRALPEDIAALLAKWDVSPGALELEFAESSVMADPERTRTVLRELDEVGVALSIDDFGTGFSSLGFLHDLPISEIKIDRSFVLGLAHDQSDASIVRSTIDVGRNLGLRVVAEGIETEDVRAQLMEMGCHVGQGYLFSRPLDGDALARWATDRRALVAP